MERPSTPAHSLTCCYSGCQQEGKAIVEQSDSHVAVRTGAKVSPDSPVKWTRGEAVFHVECWQTIEKLSKKSTREMSAADKKAVASAAETAEFHDSKDVIDQKATAFVERLKQSKHACAFTGAGISTAAGIGDYRGKSGKWTLEDQLAENPEVADEVDEGVDYEHLLPTYSHEALTKMHSMGHLKYLISQNCDGLHLLSGFPEDALSELHGNVFIEECDKCGRRVHRNFYVLDDENEADTCPTCHNNHLTGRKCPSRSCKGNFRDTIINFGDMLPEKALSLAETHSKQCDLMLSLGTSLKVTPACDLVRIASAFCVVNRQKLKDWDRKSAIRVFGDCDAFMKVVMRKLLGEEREKEWAEGLPKLQQQYRKKRKM